MNLVKMRDPVYSKLAEAPSQFTREFEFEEFDEDSKLIAEDHNFRMVV